MRASPIGHVIGVPLIAVHLIGVYLTGVYLMIVHLISMYLMGVYLMGVRLIGLYLTKRTSHRRASRGRALYKRVPLMGVYLLGRVHHLGVFLAHRTRVARIPISTPRMFKASNCGRLGRQAADYPWSALRVVKSCRKDCLTAKVLLEAKAAALHLRWYQSLLSKPSTEGGGEARKRRADNGIDQIDRKVIHKQVEDRQTGRNRPMSAGTQADRAAS
jgi:hypothetical protein